MKNDNNVINMTSFKTAKAKSFEEECAEAYAWILDIQQTQGWYCEKLRLTFEEGDFIRKKNCIVALFHDKASGGAILLREWPDDMMIKFNQIINPRELHIRAPKSYQRMIECGLDLYRREGKTFKCMYHKE